MHQTDHQPHPTADHEAAAEPDATWLTFTELAAARGISKDSATSLVRRHGWRRQRDNRGRVRALVPLSWASGETPHQSDNQGDNRAAGRADAGLLARSMTALEDAVAALREQLAASTARADRLDLLVQTERGRTLAVEVKAAEAAAHRDQAEAYVAQIADLKRDAEVARDHLALAQAALEQAQADVRAARSEADAVTAAEAARNARGLLARLRAAWRGR